MIKICNKRQCLNPKPRCFDSVCKRSIVPEMDFIAWWLAKLQCLDKRNCWYAKTLFAWEGKKIYRRKWTQKILTNRMEYYTKKNYIALTPCFSFPITVTFSYCIMQSGWHLETYVNTLGNCQNICHLTALTRSQLIGDHNSGLTKEQTTKTMDPSPRTKELRHYPHQ